MWSSLTAPFHLGNLSLRSLNKGTCWHRDTGSVSSMVKNAIWLNAITVYRKPISELRSVTCRMGSHSVTSHPTQLNAPRLDKNKVARYSRLFICFFFVVQFAHSFLAYSSINSCYLFDALKVFNSPIFLHLRDLAKTMDIFCRRHLFTETVWYLTTGIVSHSYLVLQS